MSFTQAMQPRPVAQPQQAPPQQGGDVGAKLQTVVVGMREILAQLAKTPGVDQEKLKQGTELLRQGITTVAAAVHKGQPQG
jgi:hypothetical protein